MRAEPVVARHIAAHFRLGLIAVRRGPGHRNPETGEELPVLADEVDHGVRRPRVLGEPLGEGVQRGLGALPEVQHAQPSRAVRGLLVLRGEQQTTGRAWWVVAHGRVPSLWTSVICGSVAVYAGITCARHGSARAPGCGR